MSDRKAERQDTREKRRAHDVISEGTKAPGFTLTDQFGRDISLADFRDRQHVLLLFYPLDWTPT
jgi:peroxiredoxin